MTQISTPLTNDFMATSPHVVLSSLSPKAASSPSYSPRSPRYSPAFARDPNKSPQERLNEFLAAERSLDSKDSSRRENSTMYQSSPLATPKEEPSHQARNVSVPTMLPSGAGYSFPQPLSDLPPSAVRTGPGQLESRFIPRTSSMDSTMSTISSTTSQSQLSTQESGAAANLADIQHIIALVGSPEAAIHQLMREKKHAAAQNAQLWRLVDKQRTLVLGLNKDLERALFDKERYRKKLKEYLAQIPPVPSSPPKSSPEPVRDASPSPTPSESQDELPIQRHSVRDPFKHTRDGVESSSQDQFNFNREKPTGISSTTNRQPTIPLYDLKFRTQASMHPGDDDISPGNVEMNGFILPTSTGLNSGYISSTATHDNEGVPSSGSFTARRSLTTPRKGHPSPLVDVVPQGEEQEKASLSARKPPPAPLNLRQDRPISTSFGQYGPDSRSESEYEEILEVDEIPSFERGRKKTREEDDKEREAQLLREQQSRSQSKKSKQPKTAGDKTGKGVPAILPLLPLSPTIRAFAPTSPPATQHNLLSPPASLVGVLNQRADVAANSISERSLSSPFPLSPGLPSSPRPSDRPMNAPPPRLPREGTDALMASPPVSPRPSISGMSLSPRAPRNPIPLPSRDPTSLGSPLPLAEDKPQVTKISLTSADGISDLAQQHQASLDEDVDDTPHENIEGVPIDVGYRGLVSEAYPDLLLPPNALPSILVKVVSLHHRPSRRSALSLKGSEEEPVFILGISSRSDLQHLWQVEKPIMSLPPLDHQLKKLSAFCSKLPDRALFNSHNPTKVHACRIALEKYFESILDTPMDEKTALVVCRYLSSHVPQAESSISNGSDSQFSGDSPVSLGPGGRKIKEGYLTKRGKNFGGWKARYFILDEPTLRYYESPGGALLGSIRLHGAQIGRQNTHHATSPSRGSEEPHDHFRHAFLILEPKRKDPANHLRHVLCAESDAERDEWVMALMQYVDLSPSRADSTRPLMPRNDSSSSKLSFGQTRKKTVRKGEAEINESEVDTNSFQGVSYETTVPAQAPVKVTLAPRDAETPSPVNDVHSLHPSRSISGPMGGSIIQNAGAWGNRVMDSPKGRDKERKRSIWGFSHKPSIDGGTPQSNDTVASSLRPLAGERSKDVFGIPLSEAVANCPPQGIKVCLPAVVYRCLEYLTLKDAASEEGIFRLSGSNLVIKALRERFSVEGDVDLSADGQYHDIHAVASLLKQYLRELPSMILTRELHLNFLQVLGKYSALSAALYHD